MRRSVAAMFVPFALLLAAAGPAAPGSGDADPRASYYARGVAACTRELAVPSMSAGDMTDFCRCNFDVYMSNVPTGALPALGSETFQRSIQPATNYCLNRLPAAQAADMQRRLYSVPNAAAGQSVAAAPGAAAGPAPATTQDADPIASLRSFGDSTPVWVWAAIGLLILAFLFRRLFRRDDPSDLIGPPPSMRQSGPVRPRDTDRL